MTGHHRSRGLAVAALSVVLAGCGGSSPEPRASGSPSPSASRSHRPRRTPSATPSATASPTATPSPTPTPVTGTPIGTAEALVHLVEGAEAHRHDSCGAVAPDLVQPSCTAIKVDGGTLIAATGRLGGRKAVRLLVPSGDGYATRYEGRDDGRSWSTLRAYPAALTGHGTDSVVLTVRLTDRALTYDVLTWVSGGALVLRAHRTPLAEGRLAPRDGALDEYEKAVDGSWVRRRVAWDGRRFLLSAGTRVAHP